MRLDEKTPKGHLDRQDVVVLQVGLPNPSHPACHNHILEQMMVGRSGAWTNLSRQVFRGCIHRLLMDGR